MDARSQLVSAARAAGYRLTLLDGHDDAAAPTPLVVRAHATSAGHYDRQRAVSSRRRAWDGAAQVLCGWFGAQDKHLAKYAEMVNALGYSTLRVQMPPTTVFSLRCGRRVLSAGQGARRLTHSHPCLQCRPPPRLRGGAAALSGRLRPAPGPSRRRLHPAQR